MSNPSTVLIERGGGSHVFKHYTRLVTDNYYLHRKTNIFYSLILQQHFNILIVLIKNSIKSYKVEYKFSVVL